MKVLGSDFDNTLYFLDDPKTTSKNVEAVKKFIAQGNIFCIITGRTYLEIKADLVKLDLPYTYLACADGALILDNNDHCLKSVKLDPKTAQRAYDILVEEGYSPYVEDGYNITDDINNCLKVSAEYQNNDKEKGLITVKRILKELDVYCYASRAHINVNNKSNEKEQAVLRICEVSNINPQDFYTIGDTTNDYEMLKAFKGATIKKHNPILDDLNLPIYDTVADYIEELLKD